LLVVDLGIRQLTLNLGLDWLAVSGAVTLIEPFNPEFIIPCLTVTLDKGCTVKMWKQLHPHSFEKEYGFKKFERK